MTRSIICSGERAPPRDRRAGARVVVSRKSLPLSHHEEHSMARLFFAVIVTMALLGLSGAVAEARCTDSRVPEVRAQITAACPCTGNHGQYVSCVAHHVRDAVRNGDIDTNCKGAVTRCAARSTCGKKD